LRSMVCKLETQVCYINMPHNKLFFGQFHIYEKTRTKFSSVIYKLSKQSGLTEEVVLLKKKFGSIFVAKLILSYEVNSIWLVCMVLHFNNFGSKILTKLSLSYDVNSVWSVCRYVWFYI
jgi:hypothetical protein